MQFFTPLKNFKSRLTSIGKKEPLHFFSLVIIIALDIFVLVNLFQGLSMQKQQLDSPSEVIPYSCEQFLLNIDDSDSLKSQKISVLMRAVEKDQYFYNHTGKYSSYINRDKKNTVDIRCQELYVQALELSENKKLISLKDTIEPIQKEIRTLENENRQYRNNYDTMLLERIANQDNTDSLTQGNAKTVKNRLEFNKKTIADLKSEISEKESQMLNHPLSKKFFSLIEKHQVELKKTQKKLEFWYPLKKLAVDIIFLLPLFFFFFWLYRRSSQKDGSLVSLIASHLLVVTLIPILFRIFDLLLKIIPFHFLQDFLQLLESLNIVAIFNYVMIIGGTLLGIFVIYIFQKKIFSAQRVWNKRIEKHQCVTCGKKKSSHSEKFCSFCGEPHTEKCISCGVEKIMHSEFCNVCGVSQLEKTE